MNIVSTSIAVLQMIPAIINVLKALEEAIPGQGKGEAKIAIVRGALESVSDQVNTLWPALEKTIGIIVLVFNKTGVFQKG